MNCITTEESSKSPWAAPTVGRALQHLVICVDYCIINVISYKDPYPLPHRKISLIFTHYTSQGLQSHTSQFNPIMTIDQPV